MKLTLAISSCPNDTFMFDAIINNKIDTRDYEFDLIIADIEQLNNMAFRNEPDVTKLSYHSLFKVQNDYQLLNSGSALGKNCGPLVVSKHKIYPDELNDCKVAIPGVNTTAKLLLDLLFPGIKETKEYLFSDIEDVVLSGECDAGLVIHETRFTYEKRGLKLVADLGNIWEAKFILPIPLGGIAIKRDLSDKIKSDIDAILKKSVQFAFENPESSIDFMKQYAYDMTEDVMMKHVQLYVNDYSVNLGTDGKRSVEKLEEEYLKINNKLSSGSQDIFVK